MACWIQLKHLGDNNDDDHDDNGDDYDNNDVVDDNHNDDMVAQFAASALILEVAMKCNKHPGWARLALTP